MAAVACPQCRTQLAYVPELAGSRVLCPNCQQQFRMPGDDPGASPNEKQIAPPAFEPEASVIKAARPRCHVRDYFWLRAVQCVFYVNAAILGIAFIAGEAAVITSGGVQIAESMSVKDGTAAGGILLILVPQIFLISGLFLPALFAFAAGQLISLMIDVQGNTQEAAHYLRYLDR